MCSLTSSTCIKSHILLYSEGIHRGSVYLNSPLPSQLTISIDILTFIILYNNLIPISLIVTMEVVKFQQAALINSDLDMYYAKTDTPALCRTSSLVEELGQIEYVFSDKTGTLTRNEMEFRCCSVAGVAYADAPDESREGWQTFDALRALVSGSANPFVDPAAAGGGMEREVMHEFLCLLAVCHTVIPEMRDGKTVYQASSPDEAALVAGAELLGYQFHVRWPFSTVLLSPISYSRHVDAKAEVGIRQYSGLEPGVRDPQRLRIQLDPQAHVDRRPRAGREDQALLQGRGHGYPRAAREEPAIYGADARPSGGASIASLRPRFDFRR